MSDILHTLLKVRLKRHMIVIRVYDAHILSGVAHCVTILLIYCLCGLQP
jgi:predicted ATPase